MKQRTRREKDEIIRLMSVDDLCAYLSLGRASAVEFAREHGAEIRIGRRCLYDRKILDAELDTDITRK